MNILAKYYTKDTDLVTRYVADETIIVPVRNNVGDLDSIYTLNEVATMIWHLIDGRKSVSEIVEEICKVYDVRREEAEEDTLEFIISLKEAGLLRLNNE